MSNTTPEDHTSCMNADNKRENQVAEASDDESFPNQYEMAELVINNTNKIIPTIRKELLDFFKTATVSTSPLKWITTIDKANAAVVFLQKHQYTVSFRRENESLGTAAVFIALPIRHGQISNSIPF